MTSSPSRALEPESREDQLGLATRRLILATWLSKSAFPAPLPGNVGLLRAKVAGADWYEMAEGLRNAVMATRQRFGRGSPQHAAAMEYALRASKAMGGRPAVSMANQAGQAASSVLSRFATSPLAQLAAVHTGAGAVLGSRTPGGAARGAASTLAAALLGRATAGAAIPFVLDASGLADLSRGTRYALGGLGQVVGGSLMLNRLKSEAGSASRHIPKFSSDKQAGLIDSMKAFGSGARSIGRGLYDTARGAGGMAAAPVRAVGSLASKAMNAAPGLRNAAMGTLGAGALGALTALPAGLAASIGAPMAAYHAPSGERLKHFLNALKGAGKASLPGLAVTGLSAGMGVPSGAVLGAAGPLHGALAGGAAGSLFGPVGAAAGAALGGAGGALGPALGGLAGGLYGGLTGAPIGALVSTPGIIRSQIEAVRGAKASRAAAEAAARSQEFMSNLGSNVGKGALGLAGAYGAYRFLKDRQEADPRRQQYAQPRYYYGQ